MSNKIVPVVYRGIVDDVMANIRAEFQEVGVDPDVLQDLQSRWELKIMQSHVAEFEQAPSSQASSAHQNNSNGNSSHNTLQYPSAPTLPGPPPPQNARYALPPMDPQPPPLAGPPPMHYQQHQQHRGGPGLALPGNYGLDAGRRIPQVDGPSSSSSSRESASPPPPSTSATMRSQDLPQEDDDAAIGSDLDDSDDEDNLTGGNTDLAGGAQDIMFCTYDKVQRVKNKWKCVLKDGMVHLNGKDYLFSKCTGEFEW